MQNFETLFRRAWERSREAKLSVYILLNWLILASLAAGIAVEKTLTWLVFRRAEKTAAARKIRERCLRYDELLKR